MIELALSVAAASLLIGLAAAYALRAAPTLTLQLAGLAFLSVCVPLAAVLLSGWVMFHMDADLKILTVAGASASAAVIASLLLARSIARPIHRVDASAQQSKRATQYILHADSLSVVNRQLSVVSRQC